MSKRVLGLALALLMAFSGVSAALAATVAAQPAVSAEAVAGADSINMSVTVRNDTKKAVTIQNASGQMYDFQLLDANRKVLYTWSADKQFIAAASTTTIKTGQSVTYCETLSGKAYKAIATKAVYLRAYLTGKAGFINANGYEVAIRRNTLITVTPQAVISADSVKMSLTIKNGSKKDVSISYASSQKYDFQLLDANKKVLYTWSADKSFAQANSSVKLKAGATLTFSETLSGSAFAAIRSKIACLRATVTGSADFIAANGYEIKPVGNPLISVMPRASLKNDFIRMGVSIKNGSRTPVSVAHATAQKYDFQLLDANFRLLYTWSKDKSFAQAKNTTNVLPGKSVTFSETFSGSAYAAIRDKIVYLRVTIAGTADFLDGSAYVIKLR